MNKVTYSLLMVIKIIIMLDERFFIIIGLLMLNFRILQVVGEESCALSLMKFSTELFSL